MNKSLLHELIHLLATSNSVSSLAVSIVFKRRSLIYSSICVLLLLVRVLRSYRRLRQYCVILLRGGSLGSLKVSIVIYYQRVRLRFQTQIAYQHITSLNRSKSDKIRRLEHLQDLTSRKLQVLEPLYYLVKRSRLLVQHFSFQIRVQRFLTRGSKRRNSNHLLSRQGNALQVTPQIYSSRHYAIDIFYLDNTTRGRSLGNAINKAYYFVEVD